MTVSQHSTIDSGFAGNGHRDTGGSRATAAQPSSSAADGEMPQTQAPAFLLVHGFGAFGEQWRGQIKALTSAGYQVHAFILTEWV